MGERSGGGNTKIVAQASPELAGPAVAVLRSWQAGLDNAAMGGPGDPEDILAGGQQIKTANQISGVTDFLCGDEARVKNSTRGKNGTRGQDVRWIGRGLFQ